MKKRLLLAGLAVIMSMAVFAGCGSSKSENEESYEKEEYGKEDYKKDLDEFAKMDEVHNKDVTDFEAAFEEIVEALTELDIVTPEGKDVRNAAKEFMKYTGGKVKDLDKLAAMTDEEMDTMQNEMDKLDKQIGSAIDKFKKAAEKAGIDQLEMEDLEEHLGV